jgi:MFS family permease
VVGVLQGLARMDSAALHRGAPLPRAKGQLREGLAYLRSRRDLLLVVSVMGVVSALGLNFPITLALMARQEFHGDARSYGLLSSALAVGSLVAAVVATRRKRPRQRTLLLGAFAFGISEVVAALMPTYLSFALSLVAVGAMVLTFTTTCNATVQLAAGEQVRGRVMSLYLMVFLGTTPIGAPIIGWVCQVWGPRVGLLVGGGGSALAAVLAGVWLVRREHAEGRTLLMPRLTWRDQEPVVPLVGSR